ncbi:MAG: hypothetical protein FGM27_07200 [Candidatus Omnitrophica bacterium]|nr:hypothetical protein [Candidatus Omnitrophota bacterium]
MQKISSIFFCLAVMSALCGSAYARTDRIFDAGGQGYRDVTVSESGSLVGETRYSITGQIQKSMTVDADADTVTEIDYVNGMPRVKRLMEIGGILIRSDRFNEKGHVLETERFDETGPVFRVRYVHDRQGLILQASRVSIQGDSLDTTHYSYESGRLVSAVRLRTQDGQPMTDTLRMDADGAVIEESGNPSGILEWAVPGLQSLPPRIHEKRDSSGNRIRIKQNRNETFDVTVYDKIGRVLAWQKLRASDCPGKDLCSVVETSPARNNPPIFTAR